MLLYETFRFHLHNKTYIFGLMSFFFNKIRIITACTPICILTAKNKFKIFFEFGRFRYFVINNFQMVQRSQDPKISTKTLRELFMLALNIDVINKTNGWIFTIIYNYAAGNAAGAFEFFENCLTSVMLRKKNHNISRKNKNKVSSWIKCNKSILFD